MQAGWPGRRGCSRAARALRLSRSTKTLPRAPEARAGAHRLCPEHAEHSRGTQTTPPGTRARAGARRLCPGHPSASRGTQTLPRAPEWPFLAARPGAGANKGTEGFPGTSPNRGTQALPGHPSQTPVALGFDRLESRRNSARVPRGCCATAYRSATIGRFESNAFVLVEILAMQRNHVWHFLHDPRLSLAQSGMRAAISHSQTGSGGAALMLSRVANWAKGLFDIHRTTVPAVGVCGGEPVMKAFGTVLDHIVSGAIKRRGFCLCGFRGHACRPIRGDSAARASSASGSLHTPPQAYALRLSPPASARSTYPAGLSKDCMDLVAQYLLAWVFDDQSRKDQIQSEFKESKCDPGWLDALNAWLLFYWDHKLPVYNPPSEGTVPIPLPPAGNSDGLLRVGILGDWGTGEPEAIAVLDQLMQLEPDLIIHLGDIYYAGTFDECRTNFLIPIQAALAKYGNNLPVYNIPGNHDYYSGGKGFFAILPLLNQGIPNASVQENSFLCLQNDQWQLQCMDTGYNDHDLKDVAADITHLEPAETEWHQSQLLAAGSRKIILISHHQLFSAFATIGTGYQNPFLTKNLADWRAAGVSNITVWLWGHEHLLEIYAPPASDGSGLPVLGRCVGHGAFPIFDNSGDYNKQPQSPIPLQTAAGFPNGYIQTGVDGQVYASGFAMLTLGAEDGKADYYQVDFTGDINAARRRLLWSDGLS